MMLDGPMKDPAAMGWPQSVTLPDELQLGKLIERTRVHSGLLIALGLAAILWGLMRYSTFGFAVRAAGANARAAAFAGVPGATHPSPRWRCCPAHSRGSPAHRSRGPHRLRHARHVARLWLLGHRHRDARGPQSARRRSRRDLRGGACWSAPTA
jgi:hypothetical protein